MLIMINDFIGGRGFKESGCSNEKQRENYRRDDRIGL